MSSSANRNKHNMYEKWSKLVWSYLTDQTQLFTRDSTTVSQLTAAFCMGRAGFISYTEHVVNPTDRHSVQSHMYADDTQFYDSCHPSDTDSLPSRLSHCAFNTDLQDLQCISCRLQLNDDKTEAIWFGSKSNLTKPSAANMSVQVGSAIIQPSAVVRDLGLNLDSQL